MNNNGLLTAVLILLTGAFGSISAMVPVEPIWNLDTFADVGGGGASNVTDRLEHLYADYNEEFLKLNPIDATFRGDHRYDDQWINELDVTYLNSSRALVQKYLSKIDDFDPEGLKGQDRISYDVFKYALTQELTSIDSGFATLGNMMPINQLFSVHNLMPQLGSGQSVQSFKSVRDYENWLKRSAHFADWTDSAIHNMRDGMKKGVVQPRVVMNKIVPQLKAHIVDRPDQSIFYKPIETMPDTFSREDRDRLTDAYRNHIDVVLVPAYARLHDFVVNDYIPHARESVGLSDIPGGKEMYAHLTKRHTTTNLSPEEIHKLGKREAQRIYAEMEKVKSQVGFDGTMEEWFLHLRTDDRYFYSNADDLIAGYEILRDRIDPSLDNLFGVKPKTNYVIKEVEPYRSAAMAAGQYNPGSPDGTRPGVFYVNTYDIASRPKYVMEALTLHEANPGHHFQATVAQELTTLPDFRRFQRITAYAEGWGLYAESLGEELGLYEDPYQYFGKLYFDIWRANRLVVDTGMHALGWSRQEAIDWMLGNSPMTEQDVTAEVDRYIARPGQALAYKIGQLEIRDLRNRAEAALGDRFDIRAFHDAVLTTGSVPLDVLQGRIERWIDGQS